MFVARQADNGDIGIDDGHGALIVECPCCGATFVRVETAVAAARKLTDMGLSVSELDSISEILHGHRLRRSL